MGDKENVVEPMFQVLFDTQVYDRSGNLAATTPLPSWAKLVCEALNTHHALNSSPSFNTGVEEAAKVARQLMQRGGYPPDADEVCRAIRALSDQSPSNGEQDNAK